MTEVNIELTFVKEMKSIIREDLPLIWDSNIWCLLRGGPTPEVGDSEE